MIRAQYVLIRNINGTIMRKKLFRISWIKYVLRKNYYEFRNWVLYWEFHNKSWLSIGPEGDGNDRVDIYFLKNIDRALHRSEN